jgi:hypothetical protein
VAVLEDAVDGMGAKTWMLIYAADDVRAVLKSAPELDRGATRELVTKLHHGRRLKEIADGTLHDNANPPDGYVYAGCFPGLTVICTGEAGGDYPSRLDRRFLEVAGNRTVYLHAMHSVVDWFAYGVWTERKLIRALSLSPDSGILENIGDPLPFEQPYWAGEKRVETDPGETPYPLPFHPLELGEETLRALFGFNYEGIIRDDDPDLEAVSLAGFAVTRGSLFERLAGWFGRR